VHLRPTDVTDREAVRTVHERSVRELAAPAYSDEVVQAWVSPSDSDADDADDEEAEPSDGQPENGYRLVAEAEPVDGESVPEVLAAAANGADVVVGGFGDVRFEPPDYLSEPTDGGVRAVYVDPAVAGTGVGSAILEHLEAVARDRGLDSLGLHSSVNARSFYEAHGYEPVTELTFEFGVEVEGPSVEMCKDL
jgi:GNAT superfamily N-acetyltransferase